MRKFRITLEVEDKEATDETLGTVAEVYREIIDNSGFAIAVTKVIAEEIQPQS